MKKMDVTQKRTPLYEALKTHIQKNTISFHVPGHKNGCLFGENLSNFRSFLQYDVTEISGLDDFHNPEEAIFEAQELLSSYYKTEKSYFLVNGSTVGNLAMILGTCEEGDLVLVQRNCHKSVIHALMLSKLQPVFISPEVNKEWKVANGLSKETISMALNMYPNVKAIILTYPNYFGIASNIEEIIKLAHSKDIPVLVDEAHGAHFILGKPFPKSALSLGADVVVQSAHKTLPAMTMGSFLHINSSRVNKSKIERYLHMLQSSSPSYPIMVSLDLARHFIANFTAEDKDFTIRCIQKFKEKLKSLKEIRVLLSPNQDPLKITLQTKDRGSGYKLQEVLENEGIFCEMADPYNVLLVLPLLKKDQPYRYDEAFIKIKQAVKNLPEQKKHNHAFISNSILISKLELPYHEMGDKKKKLISLDNASGKVCGETIIPYPPGVPLLMEGEKISEEAIYYLNLLLDMQARFHGGENLIKRKICIFE